MFCNGDEDNLDRFRVRTRENGSPERLNRTPTFQRREHLKKAQASGVLAKSKSGDANNVMSAFQSEELAAGFGAAGAQGAGSRDSKESRDAAKRLLRSLSSATNESEGGLLSAVTKVVEALSSFDYPKCLYTASEIMTLAQASGSTFMEELGGTLLLLCYAEYFFHDLDFLLYTDSELLSISEVGNVRVKPSTPINPISLYTEATVRMNELLDFMVNAYTCGALDADAIVYRTVESFWNGYLLQGNSVDRLLQPLISMGGDNVLRNAQSFSFSSLSSPDFVQMDMEELEAYLDDRSTINRTELTLALRNFADPRAVKLLQQSAELVDGLCGVAEIRIRLLRIYKDLRVRFDIRGSSRLHKRRADYSIVAASECLVELRGQAKDVLESSQDLSSDRSNPYVSRVRKILFLESQLVYRIVCAGTDLSAFRIDKVAVSLCLARKFLGDFSKYIEGVSEELPNADSGSVSESPAAARLKRRNLSAPPQSSTIGTLPGSGRMTSCSEDVSAKDATVVPVRTPKEPEQQQPKQVANTPPSPAVKQKLQSFLGSMVSSLEQRASVYFHNVYAHHKLTSDSKSPKYQLMKRIENFVRNELRLRQHTVLVGLVLETTKLQELSMNSLDHARAMESPCSDQANPEESLTNHMPLRTAPNGYLCPQLATSPAPNDRAHFEFPIRIWIKDRQAVEFSKAVTLAAEIHNRQDQEAKGCDPFQKATGMSQYPLIYSSSDNLRRHLPSIASLLMSPGNSDCLDSLQPLIHKDVDNVSYRLDRIDAGLTLVIVYRSAADWKELSSIVALLRGACTIHTTTAGVIT